MSAAPTEGGRETARESFEERIRAGIVLTRREIHVLRAHQLCERLGGKRPDETDALESCLRVARERELMRIEIEIAVEPFQDLCAFAWIVRPAAGDHTQGSTRLRTVARRRPKDRRVDCVVDHDRSSQLESELAVLVEAVVGLQDGRVRELVVDGCDPPVGAVVEAAVDADGTVDAVHHAHAVARETAQSREVEIEGVEEAARCAPGEAVDLDTETAALELADKREQELVPAAVGRGPELVEDGQIRSTPAGAQPVGLRSATACKRPHRLSGAAQQGSRCLGNGHLALNRRFTTRAETSPDTLGDPR